jgi:type II secretory pathway component GspD/PulD (secretin)
MVPAFKRYVLFYCLTASIIPFGLNAWGRPKQKMSRESRYKINFSQVKAEEFIGFLSEIAGLNFVYNPAELNFSINLVSDEEMTVETVVSGFVQTLRIQGFSILEENGTLVIHKNPDIKEMPLLFGSDLNKGETVAPIVTKIYQIRNSPVATILTLLQPYLSSTSVIEAFPERKLIIISDVIQNILSIDSLVKAVDQPETGAISVPYETVFFQPTELVSIAAPILDTVCGQKSYSLLPQEETQRVFVVGSKELTEKALDVFQQIEEKASKQQGSITNGNIYLYKGANRSIQSISTALRAISKDSKTTEYSSAGFTRLVNDATLIAPDFILFIGEPVEISKVQTLIKTIDTPQQVKSDLTFSIVKLKFASGKMVMDQLRSMARDIPDDTTNGDFLNAMDTLKWNKDTNSIVIQGSPHTIQEISDLISKIDQQTTTSAGFSIIKLQNVSGKFVEEQLDQMASQLPDTPENIGFIQAVKDVQWNKTNNTLTIRGSPQIIQQLTEIITKLDIHTVSTTQYIIYRPIHMSASEMMKSLEGITNDLEKSGTADPSLIQTLRGIKLVKNSNSIIVSGSEINIGKVRDMINAIDSQTKLPAPVVSTGFSIIKLQNVPGKFVIEHLDQMASQLPDSPENMGFIRAVKDIQWNKANNTLTIRGTPQTIQQLTEIITKLDIHTVSSTQYIIYRPTNMSAAEMIRSLQGIANDLENSGNADPNLIQTLKGIKLVKNSNSIIVSGSEANIAKVREMINAIDLQTQTTSKISQVGTSTFLSYSPKTKSAKELLEQLKSTTKEMRDEDPDLVKTVYSAKITDGILVFSGTPENLEKVEKLLESFDQRVPGLVGKKVIDNYQNYKPVYKSGPELIKEVQTYMDHISNKGVNDHGLSKSIDNLQFLNGRIVVVGAQENINQILKLLQEFDTPTAETAKPLTSIESFDNIGFLNYKLNFHTGSDIQAALKQIGEELQLSKNAKNESLITAISSVQWIRVTNSLIATGDPQTLSKLKDILSSIDIPLKQVFIEVLVLETTLRDVLDIGLRWGGYSNFKGKFAGVGTNNPRVDAANLPNFQDTVKGASTSAGGSSSGVNAVNGPSPNLFPSLASSQLGIIGDIIFHGGKSYLTLTSLLTALQEEGRTTTILNQKILAQDSRMSQIFVGQNVPFTGSIITTSGISQTTNANLEYRNIGVSLNITPNIGDNGIITLEIDEEITEEANIGTSDNSDVNTQSVNGIRTNKTSMQTRVHVPDKAFVVLSGQIRNTKTVAKSGLPCLGGLPMIGAAFSQSLKENENADVVIFIRPEIIQTTEQWKEISEQQEDIYRDQSDPEAFDFGVDLVKRD